MRRMRPLLLVAIPAAAFALVFFGTLAYYAVTDDDAEPAATSGSGRLVLSLGVESEEPVEAYLASVALDGSDLRPITEPPGATLASDASAAISPDGTRIAFSRAIPGESPRLYVVNVDGSGLRRVTEGSAAEISPAWSPAGTRIVFARTTNDRFDLFVVTPDGSGLTQLTDTPNADDDLPTWTTDGIFFTRFADDDEDVWVMDPDGSNGRAFLVGQHDDSSPAWSPDLTRIAFVRDGRITIFDGENFELITDGGSLKDAGPSWSPDGTQIVFTRDPGTILVVGLDGSEPAPVPLDGRATGAVWVPQPR
jgi:Tol biopolymer transport system component